MRQLKMALAVIILMAGYTLNVAAAQAAPPKITADAAILMDADTGQIFFTKNHKKRRAPASLTKITTALIALEYGRLNEVVTVSKRAASVSVGSILDLRDGEKITLENLLKGALIFSANDTTVAIAEHVGGSHDTFLHMMNAKAKALGAWDTNYTNTNGYSAPNHYSSAYDLGMITVYALKNPLFNKLVSTKETRLEWRDDDRTMDIRNTNRLLRNGDYPGIDGVKTGSAVRAGKCLIASATRGERRLLAVVLHSQNRYLDAGKLLDYGFENIEGVRLYEEGNVIGRIPVNQGLITSVEVRAAEPVNVDLIKEELDKVERRIELEKTLTAPVAKGQKLGELEVVWHDQLLARVDLVAGEKVPVNNWYNRAVKRIFG